MLVETVRPPIWYCNNVNGRCGYFAILKDTNWLALLIPYMVILHVLVILFVIF